MLIVVALALVLAACSDDGASGPAEPSDQSDTSSAGPVDDASQSEDNSGLVLPLDYLQGEWCNTDGEAWAIEGPPALCAMLSRLGAFGAKPDLIVSGINPGANVGRSVYHSGTVGAALTGRNGGISGIAISQAVDSWGIEGQGWDEVLADQRWDTAAEVAGRAAEAMLANLPAEPLVLNLNAPNLPLDEVKGAKRVPVGTAPPRSMGGARLDPKQGHEGSYKIVFNWGEAVAEETVPDDTDVGAVMHGYVAMTWLSPIGGLDLPANGAETAVEALF